MNSDSIFIIGESHQVCEDYASNIDKHDESLALMSDGCSGSNNTDVGARLLVHSGMNWKSPFQALHSANNIRLNLNLEETVLDATLFKLSREKQSKLMNVFAFGDGFIAQKLNNSIIIREIDAPKGYPKYLSYLLNEIRNIYYLKQNGYPTIKTTVIVWNEEKLNWMIETESEKENLPHTGIYEDTINIWQGNTVAIFSDGVASFVDKNNNQVDPLLIIAELMNFKNYKGEFVKRRVKKALKTFKDLGYRHHDDISMAAIHIGED